MSTIYRSFAKVNLHLQVVARRPDGYHELETLFQTVALCDLLTLALTAGDIDLQVTAGEAPAGEANLAFRAARQFLERYAPAVGVRIELEKRTPVGGGLGGGSSNAATVLLALQNLIGEPAESQEMLDLASGLGADVPYFLVGGTALGRGRGDRLTELAELPERSICLVTPPISISTAEIFDRLDLSELCSPPNQIGDLAMREMSWSSIETGWNDLETTVMRCYPMVRDVYNALVEGGATLVRLSGTGATVFAFFRKPPEISELTSKLPRGSRVVHTRTLNRSSLDRLRVV
jgi:4-diphosphocytidyl-2-C-methyl-D-erythritol kinase